MDQATSSQETFLLSPRSENEFVGVKNSPSELRIGSQAVELLRRVLFSTRDGRLAEAGGDLVKRPALGLGDFEVGENEEEEQQHGEDDKYVRATQLL